MPYKSKIIIVDDHSTTLDGIKKIVEKVDFVEITGTASSGKEALEIIENEQPDILITDIEMSDTDGIELSEIVKKKYPNTKIIIVTLHSERWIISKLLKQDIESIILKSKTDGKEISEAIKKVNAGERYYSDEIKDLFFQLKSSDENTPGLTLREREIIVLICQELTIKEIADKLCIATRTVETHRSNLFTKLKVKSQSGIVREAIKFGFYTFE